MEEKLPIKFQEHAQLQALGIHASNIGFNTLTLESDRFICVREKEGTNPDQPGSQDQVVIIDTEDLDNIVRRPITADSAMMHPTRKIIALKAARQLQIFNIETKTKIKSFLMDQNVIFWKWICTTESPSNLGIITDTSVYHWNIDTQAAPTKIFDRHSSLQGCQMIQYRINPEEKWMILIGITVKEGRVVGAMQLYSREKGVSQPIEGHAASFASINSTHSIQLFTFAVKTATSAKLHIVEIDHKDGTVPFPKRAIDIFFPPEASNDFPVAMQVSSNYDIIFLITKFGFVHLYDLETGLCLYMNRISSDTIFVTAPYTSTSGIIGVNRRGQVLSISIDEDNIAQHVMQLNIDVAMKLAAKGNLPGAEEAFVTKFNLLMQQGSAMDAARIAATSPQGILRTPQTIELLKQIQTPQGQLSPILQYFGMLLEKGDLNKHETIELSKPVLLQGRKQLLEKWLKEDKLECSEELGDLVKSHDTGLALSVYLRANVPSKVIQCFAETGQFDKIVLYSNKVNYHPDYSSLLTMMIRIQPDSSVSFANIIYTNESGSLLSLDQIINIFTSLQAIPQLSTFLLEALKNDLPDQGQYQTKLLELNLAHTPQVADAILSNGIFSHYDVNKIAKLCEHAGLYTRALELTNDIFDMKRILSQHTLSPEWLLNWWARLDQKEGLECMREMLQINLRQNLQTCVQIAIKYSHVMNPISVISLFEEFKTFEGLYLFLGSIVNQSQDSNIIFKYIQSACKTGQLKEVERICRTSQHYDSEKVKNFLKEAKLSDQLPLIIVCDRFNYVHDLVLYLYQNNLFSFIEVYVQRVNSIRTPSVLGALLDIDCDEQTVKNLLLSVEGPIPIDDLVEEMEHRDRLRILLPWLESKLRQSTSIDSSLMNALAKIYIDMNQNAEQFLKDSDQYDPKVIGKYCEKKNPYLAIIAYEKGLCDEELFSLTNDNSMFKQQARYLMKRKSLDLWNQALSSENMYRKQVIDQVVFTALPECKDAEDIRIAVRGFMAANLPNELVEILEKLVMEEGLFSDNKNLQNLLILTAIQSSSTKVSDYINKLSNYEPLEMSQLAIKSEMYEEAWMILNKFGKHLEAMQILVNHIRNLDRAYEYAERHSIPQLWSCLGSGQLQFGLFKEAVNSFIKADDSNYYNQIIQSASDSDGHDLIRYLQMARKKIREPVIENEFLFMMAKMDRLIELEEALASKTIAQAQIVGDKCFQNGLYQAARLLYSSISDYSKLSVTLVLLNDYTAAVEYARKANSTKVWKQLSIACLDQGKTRLAQTCGLNLIVHADELEELIRIYEFRGLFQDVIQLLETGIGLDRSHMGIFTELGILYSKYRPEKLVEHLKIYWTKLNIPKVIRVVEEAHQWNELVFLYIHYDEYDHAIQVMMKHSPVAYEHDIFKNVILKVSNVDLIYKAIRFYLDEQPLLLNDLMGLLSSKIDHGRAIQMFQKCGHLPIIKSWLISMQQTLNHNAINTALNELYIDEDDYESLLYSIEHYDNFDHITLATRLEQHPLLEFRRIASLLYKKNKRWRQALSIAKRDHMFQDAMETIADSKDSDTAEELLRHFVELGDREYFITCLYICYDLLRPDVVLELSWQAGLENIMMPYTCQVMREYSNRIETLEKEALARTAQEENPILTLPSTSNTPLMITNRTTNNMPFYYPVNH